MIRTILLRLFFIVAFVLITVNFLFANSTNMKQNERYNLMTKDIVCISSVRDGRILFSNRQSYAIFAEHLRIAGFNPQMIRYEEIKKNLLEDVNNGKKQGEIICKDLIFLFLEGFTLFLEEFDEDD